MTYVYSQIYVPTQDEVCAFHFGSKNQSSVRQFCNWTLG